MHKQFKISKSFTRKRILLFVLIFSMVVIGAGIYRFEMQKKWLHDDFARQTQSIKLNNVFAKLSLYIKEAESDNRGYAFSGDKKYDKNFDAYLDSIHIKYLLLQHLQKRNENKTDTTLFLKSDSLMQEKIAWMDRVNTLCEDGDRKAALALIATNKGLGLSDSIIKINSTIIKRLDAELNKSQISFLLVSSENDKLAYWGIAVSMLLILLVFYFLIKEIRRTERISEELRERKEHYKVTLNSIGEGLISTNLSGEILYMNPSAERLTGWSNMEAKNQPLQQVYNVINEETNSPFENMASRIIKTGEKIEWENNTILKAKNSDTFIISNNGSPILDAKGNISGAVLVFNDITEKKKAENQLKRAIHRYDILSQATSDTIWDWDMVTNQIIYNDGLTKMFGYKISEVDNAIDWWIMNIHPDDLQTVSESVGEVSKKEIQNLQLEYRFRCADETFKYIYDRAFVIYDEHKKPIRMIGAMQDITFAKEEEKRIAKAIIDAQEEERSFIGGELHDNVNQILAGSLLTLSMAKAENSDKEQTIEYIETTQGYINNAIDEIRKLSHQLAPATFDNTSLRDVFEDLLQSINLNNKYNINLHFDDINKMLISDDIQINLFRILQEQTKNILKYAEATTIEIAITLSENVVRMRIYDNGKGFDTKAVDKGIGLSNIKKRAESFGGKFILNSEPGNGCEIIVEIPLENNDRNF